jgi:tetratricopeptide (TPR) repeat protein
MEVIAMLRKVLSVSLVLASLAFSGIARESFGEASAYFEQAKSYYEAGEYQKARELYEYVGETWPGDANYAIWSEALVILSYIDVGKMAAAEVAIDALLIEFGGDEHAAEVVHHIAYQCLTLKRYEKARELYQYVLDNWRGDDSSVIWSQTGVAMSSISLGDTEAADAAAEKLVTEFSENSHIAEEVHHLAWHCRYVAGDHNRAVEYYEYVLDHWPDDEKYAIWSQSGLALSYIDIGDNTGAQAAIDKLVAEFADDERLPEEVHHIAYHYREVKEYGKARVYYQYVLDNWPGSKYAIWSQSGVGSCSAGLGETEAAEAATEKLLSDFSGHADLAEQVLQVGEPYYDEGLRKKGEGLELEAREDLQRALGIYETVKNSVAGYVPTAETDLWRGACYGALGEYQKSAECYQKAADDELGDDLAWYALFMVGRKYESLKESGAISETEADAKTKVAYEEVVERYPDCPAAKIAERWLNRN